MKKLLLITIFISSVFITQAQGLEGIIVEKYYVSNSDDADASAGTLPVGSVTYRIYVDMLPYYKFKAAYGSSTHELFIATTTSFFNNEDRGAETPTFTKVQAKSNTVMLDSWISAGQACGGVTGAHPQLSSYGIMKSEDNGDSTVVNSDGVLQNNDARAGIPLTEQDGLIGGHPQPVSTIGIDAALEVFNATSQEGNLFSVTNGAWSALYGAYGPDSATENRVLIAQVTTDGVLTFELNVQVQQYDVNGQPVLVNNLPVVEQYVANNPTGDEMTHHSLTYPDLATKVTDVNSPVPSSFTVYPNPSRDLIMVDMNASKDDNVKSYTLYDLSGKMLLTKVLGTISGRHRETIDLSSLAQGAYILKLTTEKSVVAKKVIKN